MFRGVTKETQRVCEGWAFPCEGKWYMILDDVELNRHGNGHFLDDYITDFIEIEPDSIAQSTGLKDKNDTEIYGSIEIDGKMSRGGDVVDVPEGHGNVIYENGGFTIKWFGGNSTPFSYKSKWNSLIEVIGSQWEDE